MQITNFLNIHNIKWFPLSLEITKTESGFTKKPLYSQLYSAQPKTTDFKTLSDNELKARQALHEHFDHIAIDTASVQHIDIDFKDNKDYDVDTVAFEANLKDSLPYFKSTTKKRGKHYFFKDPTPQGQRYQTEHEDIEILCGLWSYCPINQKVRRSKKGLVSLNISKGSSQPAEIFTALDDEMVQNKMESSKDELDEQSKIGMMSHIISLKFLDNYDDWSRIVWALHNNDENHYDLAKEISKKSKKYDEKSFNKLWNSAKSGNTIGTVFHFAKLSNEKKYFEIMSQFIFTNEYLSTDDTLAKIFLEGNELDYIYKDEVLYCFHKNFWVVDRKNYRLSAYISNYLAKILKLKLEKINSLLAKNKDNESYIKQKESLIKNITAVYSTSKVASIVTRVIQLLSLNDYDHIQFDKNGYLFNFKNKTYDLKSHIFVNTRREDYILTTCGYNYDEVDDKDMKVLDDLLNTIFEDSSIKQNYVHYMATALYGVPIEKFVIANGSGGNGKGVINELLMELLGDGCYGYTAPNNVLLQPLKTGNNPEVANMNSKRLVIYREPDAEKAKINGATMKELTGGNKVSARMNYSNDMKVVLVSTHILECNKKPLIDGRIDESYIRRLVDIPFKSTFTSNKEMLDKQDELDSVYKANTFFKSQDFKDKYKYVLFQYLVNYCKKYETDTGSDVCSKVYECDEVVQRTKEYLQNSDETHEIILEHFERTDTKTDFVKVVDIWTFLKTTDYYHNLTRNQKKNFTKKQFIETIKTNINFKMYYKPRFRQTGLDIAHVLIYHKSKELEDESDDESNALDM